MLHKPRNRLAVNKKILISTLFILGSILSVFTSLRFSFIGIGEILLMSTLIFTVYTFRTENFISSYPFTAFFGAFLIFCLIGSMINNIILDVPTGTYESMIFDFSAYVFIFLACIAFEVNYNNGMLDAERTLYHFTFGLCLILTLLFIISFFSDSFLGLTIKYDKNFAPLVENVHQSTMMILPLPAICLAFFYLLEGRKRILMLIFFLSTLMMCLTMQSSKAILALIASPFVYLFLEFLRRQNYYMLTIQIIILLWVTGFIFVYFEVFVLLISLFKDADQGSLIVGINREYLYSNAIQLIGESPLFGRGSGAHILKNYMFWDIHQSFLTVAVQGGLMALLALLVLMFKIYKQLKENLLLLVACIPILVYFAGGDVMRRAPIWILLMFLYYYLESRKSKNT